MMSWREATVGESQGSVGKNDKKGIKEPLYNTKDDAWDVNLWQTCEFNEHREHYGMITLNLLRYWLQLKNEKTLGLQM